MNFLFSSLISRRVFDSDELFDSGIDFKSSIAAGKSFQHHFPRFDFPKLQRAGKNVDDLLFFFKRAK
jgi:hypothetical protein